MRIIVDLLRFYYLLLNLGYLYVCKFVLLVQYYGFILAKTVLLEAVELWCTFKCMKIENRIIFAACIAVSIYGLTLITLIRM